MAFDLFVGSFTRYISGDWENFGQRAAREAGIPYKIIRDNETEEAPPPTEEIQATVEEWRQALSDGLKEVLPTPLAWDESAEATYVTDRPDWHGYSALLLLAAYADAPDLGRPTAMPEEWGEDPAYQRATAEDSVTRFPAIVMANLWLPGTFDFMFGIEDLGGNPRAVASTAALAEELAQLNAATFKASAKEIDTWRKARPADDAPLDDHAKFGLAVLTFMCSEALRLNAPLMPDY